MDSNGHYDLNAARKAGYRLLERLDDEEALVSAPSRAAPEAAARTGSDPARPSGPIRIPARV